MNTKVQRSIPLATLLVGILTLCYAPTLARQQFQSAEVDSFKSTDLKLTAKITRNTETGALVLEWTLRNSATRDLSIRDTNLLNDYIIEVTNRQNTPVPLTEYGQRQLMAAHMLSRKPSFTLTAGGELTNRITVSEIYDLKRNGVYVFTVKRRFAKVLVKSNSVRIRFAG